MRYDAYCEKELPLTRDHVRAVKRDGRDEIENIVPACKRCNIRKSKSLIGDWLARAGIDRDAFWQRYERAWAVIEGREAA